MSTTSHQLNRAVREYLRERKQRGNSYVKVARIADAIGESPQVVTPTVQELVADGTLSIFRNPARNARVYRIDDVAPNTEADSVPTSGADV